MSSREPPAALDAERSVLGSVLMTPSCIDEVLPIVEVDDFFLPAHREVWQAMLTLNAKEVPIDIIPLADELKRRGALPKLEGGETYLVTLAQDVPTASN